MGYCPIEHDGIGQGITELCGVARRLGRNQTCEGYERMRSGDRQHILPAVGQVAELLMACRGIEQEAGGSAVVAQASIHLCGEERRAVYPL